MQKQALWNSLFLILGMVLFFPLTFLGLDFTDTGYHFFNQTHLLTNFEVMHMVAYHWLSDFLSAIVIKIFSIAHVFGFRILGWFVWSWIGIVSLRIFKRALTQWPGHTANTSFLILALLCGFCFSINNLNAPLVLPDYYTLPLLALLLLIDLCLGFFVGVRPNFKNKLAVLAILVSLPLLRWPLIIFSFFGILAFIKKQSKISMAVSLTGFLGFFGLYKLFFLDSIIEKESIPLNYLTNLIYKSILEIATPLPYILILVAVNATCYLLFKWRKKLSYAFAGLAALSFLTFFVLTYEWSIQAPTFEFQKYLSFILWVSCGLSMALYAGQKIELQKKEPRVLMLLLLPLLLLLPFLYFFGSDSGIRKSGYLSFLYIGPFLYFVSTKYFNKFYGALFLVSCLAFGLSFTYRSLYRDNIEGLISDPAFVKDPLVGFAITTKVAASRLANFRKMLDQFAESAGQQPAEIENSAKKNKNSLVYSNIPLLGNLLPKPKEKWIWLDILKQDEKLAASICKDKEISAMFVAKYNVKSNFLDQIDRNENPENQRQKKSAESILKDIDEKKRDFLSLVVAQCEWKRNFENEDFLVLIREHHFGL